MMLWIIGGIVLLVFALLAYVVLRYNKKANPEPATFSHNAFGDYLDSDTGDYFDCDLYPIDEITVLHRPHGGA